MNKQLAAKVFCHPICHLINGERLHYVLVQVRHRLFDAGRKIGDVLTKETDKHLGFASSSCAYYIFGQSDIIIRVWATESHLNKLVAEIRTIPEVEKLEVILIQRMLAWYQNEIEQRADWDAGLNERTIVSIASHRVPESLKYKVRANKSHPTRFFIFIEESFAKRSDIYKRLRDEIQRKQGGLLGKMQRVSIYKFTTAECIGVLVKGELATPHTVTARLIDFAEAMKQYSVKTTTFICSPKPIKSDENALNPHLKDSALSGRGKEIFYNLIRTHDCNETKIVGYGGEGAWKMAERFQQIGSGLLEESFCHHSTWWSMVDDLSLLHKWIAFGDAEKVMAKLRQRFVVLERDLNDILASCYAILDGEKWKNVCQSTVSRFKFSNEQATDVCKHIRKQVAVESHLTLGAVPKCIRSLLSRVHKVQDADALLLREFADRLEKGAIDRNRLMHGRIKADEFLKPDADNKHWAWEDYIENFLKIVFIFPRVLDPLKTLAEEFMAQEKVNEVEPPENT